jgi:hypothetical protein
MMKKEDSEIETLFNEICIDLNSDEESSSTSLY